MFKEFFMKSTHLDETKDMYFESRLLDHVKPVFAMSTPQIRHDTLILIKQVQVLKKWLFLLWHTNGFHYQGWLAWFTP